MDTSNFKEVFESLKVKALTAQGAEREAEIVRLREALSYFVQFNSSEQTIEVFLDTCEITKARKALSTPFTPTALSAMIAKASEAMRQRAISAGSAINPIYGAGAAIDAIRALPGVKMEELL